MDDPKKLMQSASKNIRSFLAPLILLIICLVSHADILSHPLMIDDSFFFNKKETSHLYPHIGDFFIKNQSTHYVPLNFLLNVSLFRVFRQPFPLYLLNLMLFYINGLLLFVFIYLISKNRATALLTSIIFCVHPMSAEILQHITFNIILVQFALILLGLTALYQYFQAKEQPVFYYVISLLAMFCALFCQETSLLFPLYAAAVLFFMTNAPLKKIIRTVTPYIFLDLLFIVLWLTYTSHTTHLIQSIQWFHLTFQDWSSSFFRLIIWYIKNLFIPKNIVFEYSLTPVSGLTSLGNLVSWGSLTGCILFIFCYFKKSLESFALVIFLTGFLYAVPASLAHPDIGLVFEPHWLYFSSIGFYLLAALMLIKLRKHIHPWLYAALLSTIFIFFLVYTQKLHATARNELSYCENWLKVSPHNAYARVLLAKHYCFEKNIVIPHDLVPDMLNTVDFLIKNNYYISAPKLIEKLSSYEFLPPQRWGLLLKSAVFHCKYGSGNECQDISNKIIQSASGPYAYMQLSYEFSEFGIENRAMALLEQCMALYPKYKEAYLLEGIILANQGFYEKSIALWERGLTLDPTDQRFLVNIDHAKEYEKEKKF